MKYLQIDYLDTVVEGVEVNRQDLGSEHYRWTITFLDEGDDFDLAVSENQLSTSSGGDSTGITITSIKVRSAAMCPVKTFVVDYRLRIEAGGLGTRTQASDRNPFPSLYHYRSRLVSRCWTLPKIHQMQRILLLYGFHLSGSRKKS